MDSYTLIVARFFALTLLAAVTIFAQDKGPKKRPAQQNPPPQQQEQEPPEEEESLKPKEYTFNPLQASKELRVGEYYMKRGSYKAAVLRFREATHWNPSLAEAYLRLGEAAEKLHDDKTIQQAYSKYLELAPDAKDAAAIRKKVSK